MRKILFFFILFFKITYLLGQVDSTTNYFYTPSVEEISQVKRLNRNEPSVSVAGFKTTTLRETPGIVTLITAEELRNAGYKDLLDVLRIVPGFDFAFDVQPVISVRGNGANEAKILLQIDGQQINDITIGYSFLMQRFPLENIERIEIIRGAGSAIYGGMAGLAVINIITKTAKANQEIGFASAVGSNTKGILMRNNIEAYTLSKLNNGMEVSISAARLAGKMTDINYNGGLYSYNPRHNFVNNEKLSDIQSNYANIGIKYKRLDVRFIANSYQNSLPHLGGANSLITGIFFNVGHNFNLNEKITIYSRVNIKEQKPYLMDNIPPSLFDENDQPQGRLSVLEKTYTLDKRYLTNVYMLYQPIKNLTISIGSEGFVDNSRYIRRGLTFRDGSEEVRFTNIGAFGEINLTSKIANLTVGGRIDKYTRITPVFVPRLALTKAFEKVHFKALFTRAFKSPTIMNIQLARETEPIRPEKFQLIEFEAGLKLADYFFVNANVYDIITRDFIIRKDTLINFSADIIYTNIGAIGTRGIEVDGKIHGKWGYIKSGYSFYQVSKTNKIIALPFVPTVFPGIPAHKFTLQNYLKLSKKISSNVTFIHFSNKFEIADVLFNPDDSREYKNEQHLHLYLNYNDFLLKNLSVGLGCHNLLNQRHWFISWKTDLSSNVILPSQGREIYLRMTYQIKS
ncbi:MAG: TonB-dependent receptor plug domain-containing protein [Flammeovirgaceae bacterium]|nr:TonB-dependent receptor plug domain-containing protein [Flammeovirgaceae bacterium]